MGKLLVILLLLVLLATPLIFTVMNIINLFKKQPIKVRVFDIITMTLGVIFSMLFYSLFDKDFNESIVIGANDIQLHKILASWHTPTILFLGLISIVAFFILEYKQNKLSPILSVLCLSTVYIGVGLSVVFIIQTSNHLFERYAYEIPLSGLYAPLFPINFIACSVRLIKKTIKSQTEKTHGNIYENRFMSVLQKTLSNSISWLIIPFLLALPLLGMSILILMVFGQQPDAIIKAFTETSDWTFSQQISPPPEHYHGHYLCTVALKGNKRLVKPTRCGIRHGTKIVVNRQLCVANAFEQVLEERLPRLHRVIRNLYDNHGYHLSKKINTEKQANTIYLFMKPLEWLFLLFLYTVDVNPENRIAKQYIK